MAMFARQSADTGISVSPASDTLSAWRITREVLTLASGEGCTPMRLFRNARRTAGRIALKMCIAHGAVLAQLLGEKWPGQVRPRNYDVIRGTASDRLFKKIVYSATELAAIDWNGDIMHGLGQQMTTSDLWHCILTFQRSSEVTYIGYFHA